MPNCAWPAGQLADHVWSLPNGSRVHCHVMRAPQGGYVYRVHIDRIDPAAGPFASALHVLTETPLGRVATLAGLFWWF
jgi:hypothetical protein